MFKNSFTDGCQHYTPRRWPIASLLPFRKKRKLSLCPVSLNLCSHSNGKRQFAGRITNHITVNYFYSAPSRIFPWGCNAGFLRNIVPDAAPQHGLPQKQFSIQRSTSATEDNSTTENMLNNNNKSSTPLLVQRTPSIGERVL